MRSRWLSNFLQMLLCACSVSLSSQFSRDMKSLGGVVHWQSQHQIDRHNRDHGGPVQIKEIGSVRDRTWTTHQEHSEDLKNGKVLRVKPARWTKSLEMSNSQRSNPGHEMPQRPQEATRSKPRIFHFPLVESSGQIMRQRPMATGRSMFSLHDIPDGIVEQRPLDMGLPMPPHHPHDLFAQIPDQIVEQRPLDMSFKEPTFEGHRETPGLAHETPQWHLSDTKGVSGPTTRQTPLGSVETPQTAQQTVLHPPPVPPESVSAVCGQKSLYLTVMMDFLGTGHLVHPADLSLGGCAPTGQDESLKELFFETPLHECGGRTQMFEDVIVYTFSLTFTPQPLEHLPIVRLNDVTVDIKCRYSRVHNVSSHVLRPTWTPYRSSKLSHNTMDFALKLMTEDWQYKRSSAKYFLGEMINIEASVQVHNHVPMRIFVEDCMASVGPEKHPGTSYVLIEKHGCLSDSKVMASRSKFMPRQQDDKLQFQIEAFRFADESLDSFYIKCTMKAVPLARAAESGHKACHYSMENDRWNSADGNDQACSCCSTDLCPVRTARATKEVTHNLILGPIAVP
ncbi:zona pellucida sperm-binding protein 3-like [Engraulis encrasicolus]|uniref:zona pellucida sperm-binding protein 3-like n=1 Tax=Engraulis encrasicolus TaxID=184585 RepID=UPI002FD413E3